MDLGLAGRVAMVTGSSQGIGRPTALLRMAFINIGQDAMARAPRVPRPGSCGSGPNSGCARRLNRRQL
jgi:hypothetical protein